MEHIPGASATDGESPQPTAWHYGNPLGEQAAVEDGRIGLVDRWDRSLIEVRGAEGPEWLNSLLTQKIDRIRDGEATYGLILNVQGHVEHSVDIARVGDVLLLSTDRRRASELERYLSSMIFWAQVSVNLLPMHHLSVLSSTVLIAEPELPPANPAAPRGADRAGSGVPRGLLGAGGGEPPVQWWRTRTLGGVQVVDVWVPAEEVVSAWDHLRDGIERAPGSAVAGTGTGTDTGTVTGTVTGTGTNGATAGPDANATPGAPEAAPGTGPRRSVLPVGAMAYHALRIQARQPELGNDLDERTIPHEVPWFLGSAAAWGPTQKTDPADGPTEASVHLNKGCYRGQETVSRVHNLGRPPRTLVLLHVDGSRNVLPPTGSEVTAGGKVVGRIGRSVHDASLGPIALGMLKRSVIERLGTRPDTVPPLLAGPDGVDVAVDPEDLRVVPRTPPARRTLNALRPLAANPVPPKPAEGP